MRAETAKKLEQPIKVGEGIIPLQQGDETRIEVPGDRDELDVRSSGLTQAIEAIRNAPDVPAALKLVREIPELREKLRSDTLYNLAVMTTQGTSLPGMDFNSSGYGLKKGSWGHIGTEHWVKIWGDDEGLHLVYDRDAIHQRAGSNYHWERQRSRSSRNLKPEGMSVWGFSFTDAKFAAKAPFYTPERIAKGVEELLDRLDKRKS